MIKKWENETCRLELDLDLFNKRIRIINYEGDVCSFFLDMMETATEHDIEKIIIFAKKNDTAGLLEHLFEPEGQIDGYYNGHDAAVLVQYLNQNRRNTADWLAQDDMLRKLFLSPAPLEKSRRRFSSGLPKAAMPPFGKALSRRIPRLSGAGYRPCIYQKDDGARSRILPRL